MRLKILQSLLVNMFFFIILLFAAPVGATTYYVKDDGNDELAGTSDATAWQTVGQVNDFSFSSGDDVYFKCDDTWTAVQLTIDWDGTSGDRVIIGAYYGSGTIGVSGTRPTFDGNNTVPSGNWQALIQSRGNYHTIENLRVINSGDEGIDTDDTVKADQNNVIIQGCVLNNFDRSCINMYGIDTAIIQNNDCSDAGTDTNPAAIGITGASTNVTIQNNKSYNHPKAGAGTGAECYGAYHGNDTITIQDNVW